MNRLLVVRLGAMGDVIHSLPAVATLRHSFPGCRLIWAIEPRWLPLVEGNPYIDEAVTVDRRSWAGVRKAWKRLRELRPEAAIDFQGLIKSAVVARMSGAQRVAGYHRSELREPLAGWFYTERHDVKAEHIVDKHIALARSFGALRECREFRLPPGRAEGELPHEFVLASPFAGWASKEWPLQNYETLAGLLREEMNLDLVLNGHPAAEPALRRLRGAKVHISSIAGLIDATRRARAVVGVDSGPLHLAAALGKRGVAIFGPTDPRRNGPYGGSMRVLRASGTQTSYQRRDTTDPCICSITPAEVLEALR